MEIGWIMNNKFFKVAQPAPPSDYAGPAAPAAPGEQVLAPMTVDVPSAHRQPVAAPKNPAVEKMQEAIVNLYDSFKGYPMFGKDPGYRADSPIPQDPKEQRAEEYGESFEHGSDSFLTFLLNRYVNKSSVIGKEDATAKQSPKTKSVNLIKFLESLKINPDGRWGKLTDNALKNLYALAQAMISLMDRLGVGSREYTEGDLADLNKAIQKRTSESANRITRHVAAIKRLLGTFMHTMDREGGNFSTYVRQQKPFETNFSEQAKKFDNVDFKVFQAMQNSPKPVMLFSMPKDIATGEGQQFWVPLSSILNKQSFQNLITQNAITVNGVNPLEDVDARNKLIDYIENKVKAMQSQPAPMGNQIVQQPPF